MIALQLYQSGSVCEVLWSLNRVYTTGCRTHSFIRLWTSSSLLWAPACGLKTFEDILSVSDKFIQI